SDWQGVRLVNATEGPVFAWTFREGTQVLAAPKNDAAVLERLPARRRVPLWERDDAFWQVGEGRWIRAADLNEVHAIRRPRDVRSQQWIDVDVGEQVLVAYRGDQPRSEEHTSELQSRENL